MNDFRFVHPKAHVEDSTIGSRTRVWQFASVIRSAVIGEDCSIGSGATVDGARIGNRCLVGSQAFIPPGIVIEDEVFVGPGALFCNDRWPRVAKEGFDLAGKTVVLVRKGASIGAGAIILPGVVIGQGAMVAAGAVVTSDLPGECLWARDGSAWPIAEPRERVRVPECSMS